MLIVQLMSCSNWAWFTRLLQGAPKK